MRAADQQQVVLRAGVHHEPRLEGAPVDGRNAGGDEGAPPIDDERDHVPASPVCEAGCVVQEDRSAPRVDVDHEMLEEIAAEQAGEGRGSGSRRTAAEAVDGETGAVQDAVRSAQGHIGRDQNRQAYAAHAGAPACGSGVEPERRRQVGVGEGGELAPRVDDEVEGW